jgi:PTH1 family peptidyl-tRNA hydrolase
MYLIIGLGNPGDKYKNTRHNIGFQFIDTIAAERELKFTEKFSGLFVKDVGTNIILFKPMNYMNESGVAVNKIKSFFKIKSEDVFVIYDDLDLELGKIKIKKAGGDAGHNGIKSIDRHIQGHYYKIRIGISRPTNQMSASNYVLSDFHQTEVEKLQPAMRYIAGNLKQLLQKDSPKFLNDYYTQFANKENTPGSSPE